MVLELRQSWTKHNDESSERGTQKNSSSDSDGSDLAHTTSDQQTPTDATSTGNTGENTCTYDCYGVAPMKMNQCVSDGGKDYHVYDMDSLQSSLPHDAQCYSNLIRLPTNHGYITEGTGEHLAGDPFESSENGNDSVFLTHGHHCVPDGESRQSFMDPHMDNVGTNSGKFSQPLRTLSGSEMKLFTSSFDDIEDVRRVGSLRKDSLDVCALDDMEKEFFQFEPSPTAVAATHNTSHTEDNSPEDPNVDVEELPFYLELQNEESPWLFPVEPTEQADSPDFRPRTLSQILMLPQQRIDDPESPHPDEEAATCGEDAGCQGKDSHSPLDAAVYRDIEGVEMKLIGSNDELVYDDKPQPSDCSINGDQDPIPNSLPESENNDSTPESCLYDSLESLTHQSGSGRAKSRDSLIEEIEDAEMQEFLLQESQIIEDAQMQEFLMHESLILDSEESLDSDLPVESVTNQPMWGSIMADSLMDFPVADEEEEGDDSQCQPQQVSQTCETSECHKLSSNGYDKSGYNANCVPNKKSNSSHKLSPRACDDSHLTCIHSAVGAERRYSSCPDLMKLSDPYNPVCDVGSFVSPNCQAPVTNPDGISDLVLPKAASRKFPACICRNKHSSLPDLTPVISPDTPGVFDFPDLTVSSMPDAQAAFVSDRLSANYVPSDKPGIDNVRDHSEIMKNAMFGSTLQPQSTVSTVPGDACDDTRSHMCGFITSDNEKSLESHSDHEDLQCAAIHVRHDKRKTSVEFEAILHHVRTGILKEGSLEPFSINSESSSESLVGSDSSEGKSLVDLVSGLTHDSRPSSQSSMEQETSETNDYAGDQEEISQDSSGNKHSCSSYSSSRESSVDIDITSASLSREVSLDRDSLSVAESLEPDATTVCSPPVENVEPVTSGETRWRFKELGPCEFREYPIDPEWIISPAVSQDQLHTSGVSTISTPPRRPNRINLNTAPITFIETLFSPTLKLEVIQESREPLIIPVCKTQSVDYDPDVIWQVTEVREPTGPKEDRSGDVAQMAPNQQCHMSANGKSSMALFEKSSTLDCRSLLSPLMAPDNLDRCPSPRSAVSRPPPLLTWDEDDEDIASVGTTSSEEFSRSDSSVLSMEDILARKKEQLSTLQEQRLRLRLAERSSPKQGSPPPFVRSMSKQVVTYKEHELSHEQLQALTNVHTLCNGQHTVKFVMKPRKVRGVKHLNLGAKEPSRLSWVDDNHGKPISPTPCKSPMTHPILKISEKTHPYDKDAPPVIVITRTRACTTTLQKAKVD